MAVDFYALLINGSHLYPMPPVTISRRLTDLYVTYSKTAKLDYLAGQQQIYGDETLWRLILWANPEYYLEYDIPQGAIIRIPMPLNAVLNEVTTFINSNITK